MIKFFYLIKFYNFDIEFNFIDFVCKFIIFFMRIGSFFNFKKGKGFTIVIITVSYYEAVLMVI